MISEDIKVGDLVRYNSRNNPTYANKGNLLIVTEVQEDTQLIRYWHSKYGDGGLASKSDFDVVKRVE